MASEATKVRSLPEFFQIVDSSWTKHSALRGSYMRSGCNHRWDSSNWELWWWKQWPQSCSCARQQRLPGSLAAQRGHHKVVDRLLPFGREACKNREYELPVLHHNVGINIDSQDIVDDCVRAGCSRSKLRTPNPEPRTPWREGAPCASRQKPRGVRDGFEQHTRGRGGGRNSNLCSRFNLTRGGGKRRGQCIWT